MIKEIETRRSIRRYKPDKPVTKEQLNQLIHAAMLAPSACNTRPWEFIAITKREVLNEIAQMHQYAKMCETATAVIIIIALPQSDMPAGYFPQCCGAATQNILLEAASMGLGSCWCGVYPKEDLMASVAERFNILKPKIPFCVIAVGVSDETPASRGFFEEGKISYIE
ncbi:MAG: nitroreductase family protein [Defluviitaleaceae bacterium]|nr:nitroreductase family protein [Defluviitaleaceae bacterium]MCL2836464.1 nitroreductase family protein [Defluviitaleaceae bacterium]